MELYLYNIEDGRFITNQIAHKDNHGLVIFPAYSTPVEPPKNILKDHEYWAYLDKNDKAPRRHEVGCWQVKKERVAVNVFNIKTREQREIADITEIGKGWTKQQPATIFDEWIAGQWVTNLDKQYQYDYNQVDNMRRALFTQNVDPLLIEADVKKIQGLEKEADLYVQQALALRKKIQDEHPWPSLPEESAYAME